MGSRPMVVGAYPAIAYSIVKFLQSLAAGAVAGVLFNFILNIYKGQPIAWQTYLLQAAALGTLVTNIISQIVACARGPNPILNTVFSAIFLIVWGIGAGILIRDLSATGIVTSECSERVWGKGNGVTTCTLYRVLFIAAIVAFLFTLISLILDIVAWRRYRQMMRNGHAQAGYAAKGTGSTQYMPVYGGGNNNGTSYQPQTLYPQNAYPQAGYQANAPYDPQSAYQAQQYGR